MTDEFELDAATIAAFTGGHMGDITFSSEAAARWPAALAEIKRLRAILNEISTRLPIISHIGPLHAVGYNLCLEQIQSFIKSELEKKP